MGITSGQDHAPSGNRHWASVVMPLHPRVMKFDITKPRTFTLISLTTAIPF